MAVNQSEQEANFDDVGGLTERKEGPILRKRFFHMGMIVNSSGQPGTEDRLKSGKDVLLWLVCVLVCVCVQGLRELRRYSLQHLPFPPSSRHFCAPERWRRRPPLVPLAAGKKPKMSAIRRTSANLQLLFIQTKHCVHFVIWDMWLILTTRSRVCTGLMAKSTRALQAV